MEDQRRYVRIPENSQILYEIIPRKELREGSTRDISQGGLRFSIHQFIPKGSLLKIRVILHEAVFSFEAVVKLVWIRGLPFNEEYEVGVQFVDIPPHAVDYLITYIKVFLYNSKKR